MLASQRRPGRRTTCKPRPSSRIFFPPEYILRRVNASGKLYIVGEGDASRSSCDLRSSTGPGALCNATLVQLRAGGLTAAGGMSYGGSFTDAYRLIGVYTRRDFRVNMWGTSLPEDKLAGDLGNVIGATSIGGRPPALFNARKL